MATVGAAAGASLCVCAAVWRMLLLLLCLGGVSGLPSLTDCGRPKVNSSADAQRLINSPGYRIVGGEVALPHSWPWALALLRNGEYACGATLVDDRFALTAAHCVQGKHGDTYSVVAGSHSVLTGDSIPVDRIVKHPLFDKFWPKSWDYAVLRLVWPSKLPDSRVQPVCLPLAPPLLNSKCIVAGWGRLFPGAPFQSTVLKEARLPIIPYWRCNDNRHYAGRIHAPTMFCAGYDYGGEDACHGDSGGPLMCERLGRWELSGVVSWGDGCGRPLRPGVYSNVALVYGWILAQIIQLSV